MNKKTLRIAGWALGLSMAVAGIGVAVGASQKAPVEANAAGEKTYSAYSGAITEGDYILVYDGGALKNTISSNRFTYSAVTISSESISTSATDIVWHIAPNGDYWTIYNETVSKYAGSSGSKNQGALLSSVTDNAKWTVTGSSTYEFENLARSNGSDPNNKWLRKNGTYGFACYASSTGGALSLYKLEENAYVVDSLTLSPADSLTIDGNNAVTTKTGTITYSVSYDGEEGVGLVDVTIKKGGADTEGLVYSDDGEGTITLTATEVGTYTVSVSTKDNDELGNPVSHDVIVTVQNLKIPPQPEKATSTDGLSIGDVVYFANEDANSAAGNISGDYLSAQDIVISENKITDCGDAVGFILGRKGSNYTFRVGSSLLGSTTAKKINVSSNGTTTWNLSFDGESNAVITSTTAACGQIYYNSSNPRFLNYTSTQTAIQMYVVSASDEEVAAEFENTYLVMNKNVENQCNTYYANAKSIFATLTTEQKALLSSEALDRLAAWAAAKGESFDPAARAFGAATVNSRSHNSALNDSSTPLIITVAASVGLLATGGIFLISRRRREE